MNTTHDGTGIGIVSDCAHRPFTCVVFLIATSLVTPRCLAVEDEPNDTMATATTSGLVGVGTVTLEDRFLGDGDWPEQDVDLYSFEIDEPTPLPVLLTLEAVSATQELDAFLRLFDESGAELAGNDDLALSDNDPLVRTHLVTSGIYYVGVSTSGNAHYDPGIGGSGRPGTGGTYTLTIIVETSAPPDSLLEPNDSIASVTFMGRQSFTVVERFVGDGDWGRRDVDIYRLIVTGPARIDVVVESEPYGAILDPVVRLRNCEDGVTERTYVDTCLMAAGGETHGGAGLVEASAGVLEAQDVYIVVSGSGNRRYDPALPGLGEPGSVGYYDLTVTVTYYDIGTGVDEPNDSLAIPVHLSPFVEGRPEVIEVDAFLGDGPYAPFQGDRDAYEITLIDEMRLVTIDVEAEAIGSDLDPIAILYDSYGAAVTFSDNWGGSADARLVLPLPCVSVASEQPSGYVMVTGTKQRPPGNLRLPYGDETIVPPHALDDGPGSTGPYHLTVSVEDVEPYADDPGDTLATATDTGIVNQGVYACTHALLGDSACEDPYLDVDMWSVEVVHAPARLHVAVSACYHDPWALDWSVIRVFSPAGVELAGTPTYTLYHVPNVLEVKLGTPGTYYIGITEDYASYDPHIPCSGRPTLDSNYDIGIVVTPAGMQQTPSRAAVAGPETGSSEEDASLLFVKRLDAADTEIDVLDADTGLVSASLPTPESRLSALGGLAYNGSHLYYLGAGKYPRLYRLDPAAGTLIDDFILWVGSGYYGDAVMLGGKLHLLDFRAGAVHVIDPVGQRFLRTLPVASMNSITITGGIAALTGPDQLYITDAFNTGNVYGIDPQSGVLTQTLSSSTDRPTALAGVGASALYIGDWDSSILEVIDRDGNALDALELLAAPSALAGSAAIGFFPDFDEDGDVDLIDYASFQRCFTGPDGFADPGCEPGDRNGDDRIDLSDFAAFPAASTGP